VSNEHHASHRSASTPSTFEIWSFGRATNFLKPISNSSLKLSTPLHEWVPWPKFAALCILAQNNPCLAHTLDGLIASSLASPSSEPHLLSTSSIRSLSELRRKPWTRIPLPLPPKDQLELLEITVRPRPQLPEAFLSANSHLRQQTADSRVLKATITACARAHRDPTVRNEPI